ncbi:AAA domain-containing protein [Tellurirhabdus bombi]|uniref:AAA domain-containing protein n=1 Tax=Tellurirhabdus bombi TaxID=2907205 RepID=UPI001F33F4C5|nr:AAA domain-containing protein [Tellurirhabdus bombi]
MLDPEILKAYARRLTNLSSRNRSLLLTSLPAEQFLDLHETDFLTNTPSFELVRQLMARRAAIPICAVLDSRHEKSNEVSRKLRKLARTSRFIEEERGTKDLYVGYPFVRGKLMDDTVIHGPLVFFPVQIEQRNNQWFLLRRADEPITLNQSFLLAYAHYNQIRLPNDWLERTLDELDKDATVFRTQLYELLKESPYEIHFNQDLFRDSLQWFDALKKSALETLDSTGELKLYPEAVLGIFPQAGSYLVPDYDVLLESETSENERDFLALSPQPVASLPPIREEHLHTPLALDASQEAAIRRVKAGESLVVQGPPGTGKSQLISNLMADFAAQGKRVLLICQKRAALDVVYERLKQVGLAPFSALIHDFKNDRKALYQQLTNQIERVDEYQKQNHGLDAVLLERIFDQESRRIDQLLAELQSFKEALFDEVACGASAKELYLSSKPTAPTIALDDVYHHFRLDLTDRFVQSLASYEAYYQHLSPQHPWQNRVSFSAFSYTDLGLLQQAINEVVVSNKQLTEETQMVFGTALTWQQAESLGEHLPHLQLVREQPADDLYWHILSRFSRHQISAELAKSLTYQLAALVDTFEKKPPQFDNSLQQLPALIQRLDAGIQARKKTFSWLLYRDKSFVQDLVNRFGLTTNLTDLTLLQLELDRQHGLYAQAEAVTSQLDLPSILTSELAQTRQNVHHLNRAFKQAAETWDFLQTTFPFLGKWLAATDTRKDFQAGLGHLHHWLTLVLAAKPKRQKYLTLEQVANLLHNPELAHKLTLSLQQDFDLLIETDRLYERFSEPERLVANRLVASGFSNWPETFLNALRLVWLTHLETQHPILRSVSTLRMNQLERDLQESILKKQSLSQQILLLKLREQTYRRLEYNRLNNLITYRDLHHQVTKKRAIWPVRKLMEQFFDEVFKIVPCWMASPESVSAIFPMQPHLFDLVIFDEASQCYAENGIPAIFRAKQVVITGDDKQLQPSDLYRIRYEPGIVAPDEDTAVELEVESLLHLASRYFPQTTLRGHYRSRSLELIDFSNQQFYKNNLQLLPDFHHLNRHEPAIRYLNVNGKWKDHTNEIEAKAVVSLIDQLQRETPHLSIGVVTFNFPQQQLIQELLETTTSIPLLPEHRQDTDHSLQEMLFVKNIENVQGDERDIIIFSIGYAPDVQGRIAAQFGSLNQKGGENRLNVAITRARERIYIITSIWPAQLSVEQVANEGPRLFRQYLEYALAVAEGSHRPQPHRTERLNGTRLLKDYLTNPAQGLVEELPFADLTRKKAGLYEELVLTDDALYYESSPKEAHAYLPLAFRQKNWPFQRVYSREFWRGKALSEAPSPSPAS